MTGRLASLKNRLPEWVSTRNGISAGVRFLLAGGALTVILISSISLYAIFYKLYVPTLLHEAPIYLQYDPAGKMNTTATVSFVPEKNYKFLSMSQAYTVSLDLRVPVSPENQQLGNFMVALKLCNRWGQLVHMSSRPAILPYKSWMLRTLETTLQSPMLALGLWQEADDLRVEMLDVMYDKRFAPITSATVSLSKPLQVYKANIVIRAQFTGLRYWMYYWRLPTALAFISAAVVWQMVFTVVAWSVLEAYAGKTRRQMEMLPRSPELVPVSKSTGRNVRRNSRAQAIRRRNSSVRVRTSSRSDTSSASRVSPILARQNSDGTSSHEEMYKGENVRLLSTQQQQQEVSADPSLATSSFEPILTEQNVPE
ncbi:putative adipose-regulatory protein-domain-containing protein [Kickxella alabastrina]|uniref:putative adipose-regulatory protein-domain-containing protein n=1 Tax=Kickxella alabastrina TaxID=61397 RepID=UPI002220CF2B|nr:putative adipose-regulatory protein-domain-containing protein [Kickxella alabastrina]KAI7833297.1 putative adipose-regulatory protein-domain-containing protein [Kickxella alabastrina]